MWLSRDAMQVKRDWRSRLSAWERRTTVYAVCFCIGVLVLLLGATLQSEQWELMEGSLKSGSVSRLMTLPHDASTLCRPAATLIGGCLVFAGLRGLLVYNRRPEPD